jgi:hypothetical protein
MLDRDVDPGWLASPRPALWRELEMRDRDGQPAVGARLRLVREQLRDR